MLCCDGGPCLAYCVYLLIILLSWGLLVFGCMNFICVDCSWWPMVGLVIPLLVFGPRVAGYDSYLYQVINA
jgi:hypothetical protein